MGNYLLSLRVPPPGEDERNHPLYYDWTIPGLPPYKKDESVSASKESFSSSPRSGVAETISQSCNHNATDTIGKFSQKTVNSTQHSAAQVNLKDTLTSTIDTSHVKPANLATHKHSKIPKSMANSHSMKKTTEQSSLQNNSEPKSNIKAVDSTRLQTVDTKRYGDIDHQAAIKAANNIHKTSATKSIKSVKISKSLKGTSSSGRRSD